MKINGIELDNLDIYDVDVAEKYEEAMARISQIHEEVKSLECAQGIRRICNSIFEIFNTMFGEGTDKKIFGDRVNLMICLKALEEFLLQMNEQKKEIEKFSNKYSPNRAARRNKKQ